MLTQERHARIIQNLTNICQVANIPQAMMYQSAKQYCNETEIEWVTRFPVYQRQNKSLLLTGKHDVSPDTKLMSLTAALVRNFLDARVLTVQSLLDAHASVERGEGYMPNPTVLMIPNLYVKTQGKGLPAWKIQVIYDLLLSRYVAGKLSVVYVEDMNAFTAEYGQMFSSHLLTNYLVSED